MPWFVWGLVERMKKYAPKIAISVVSIFVAILIVELLVRQFVQVGSFRWEPSGWSIPHPTLRYTLKPNYVGNTVAPEYKSSVVISADGIRTNDVTGDIVVVGDSFVFGVGVGNDETIPALLGAVNLGVPGYAIQQHRLTLTDYLKEHNPGVVVVCVYASQSVSGANDISGAVDFERWRGEALVSESQTEKENNPSTYTKVKKWLARNSALYNFALLRIGPSIRAATRSTNASSDSDRRMLERGWEITENEFQEFANLSDVHDFDVVIVYIPEQADVINSYQAVNQKLKEISTLHGFDYVNGMDVVGISEYYPLDGHLNASGYKKIADAIRGR